MGKQSIVITAVAPDDVSDAEDGIGYEISIATEHIGA